MDVLELGFKECNELGFCDGCVIVTTLGAFGGLPLGTYDGLGLG